MSAFKVIAASLIIACLCIGSIQAHACTYDTKDKPAATVHEFRTSLSDFELAGRSPFDDFPGFGKHFGGKSPFGGGDDEPFNPSVSSKVSFTGPDGKTVSATRVAEGWLLNNGTVVKSLDTGSGFGSSFGSSFGSGFGSFPKGFGGFPSFDDDGQGDDQGDGDGFSFGDDGQQDPQGPQSPQGPQEPEPEVPQGPQSPPRTPGTFTPHAAPLGASKPEGSEFRIVLDFSTLLLPQGSGRDYVEKLLMPALGDFMRGTLRLKYPLTEKLILPRTRNDCGGPIPQQYFTTGVDADLIVLVRASNDPRENWIAGALSCIQDRRTGRAILANINMNLAHIKFDLTKDPLIHERNIYTILHEFTHNFGFANDQYSRFLKADGTPNRNVVITAPINGQMETMVNLPPLTERLRKHFGCDQIKGALLENEGGGGSKGSHFERRVFFNEFLTASSTWDSRISEFTLAFLEGTGWYIVDYSRAEPFHAGEGKGCDFYFGKCKDANGKPAFDEFCPREGQKVCSMSFQGAAICGGDQFSDRCTIAQPEEDLDCRSPAAARSAGALRNVQVFGDGKNSKCFQGSLSEGQGSQGGSGRGREDFFSRGMGGGGGTFCFNYKCEHAENATTLEVIIGQKVVKCAQKGPITVEGYSGKIECPDPAEFCHMQEPYCPRGCMGRGECKDAKCHCKPEFKGADCAYPVDWK